MTRAEDGRRGRSASSGLSVEAVLPPASLIVASIELAEVGRRGEGVREGIASSFSPSSPMCSSTVAERRADNNRNLCARLFCVCGADGVGDVRLLLEYCSEFDFTHGGRFDRECSEPKAAVRREAGLQRRRSTDLIVSEWSEK